MLGARPQYPVAKKINRFSSERISNQQRSPITLLQRTLSNLQDSLTPSYKLGTILGTVGGVILLLFGLIYLWYARRNQRIPRHTAGRDEFDQAPRGPIEPPHGGHDRPIERAPEGLGRPLERVQQAGGRPVEQAQRDGGRPLELAHLGRGYLLERAPQRGERPLERARRGGRVRRGGNRPLELAPEEGRAHPPRGGEAILVRQGWTRPSRKSAAVRKKYRRNSPSLVRAG